MLRGGGPESQVTEHHERLTRALRPRQTSNEELSPEKALHTDEPVKPPGRIGTSAAGTSDSAHYGQQWPPPQLLPTRRRRARTRSTNGARVAAVLIALIVAAATAGALVYVATTGGPKRSDQAFVRSAYEHLLARAPDREGLAMWSKRLRGGTSRTAVAYDILSSEEYKDDLVDSYYQTYLGHPADTSALTFWVGQLEHGASDETVEEGILGSAEFYALAGGTPGGFIDDLYEKLLGRAPYVAELKSLEAQLSLSPARNAVAAEILDSNEYRTDFVDAYYRYLLHGRPDPAELDHWVLALAGGSSCESVIAGIVGSGAFYTLSS